MSAAGAQTVLSLSYNWVLPGSANNGSVYQIQNNRDSSNNRSFQYSYDSLNRLQTAGTIAGASTPWTTTYNYDNWGNLLQKSTTGSGGDPNMGPITVDAHNHVNPGSYPYDGAGNLTFDGVNYLKFDAENRLNPVSGYVYSYDGDNHRVEKNNAGSITYYWYDDNFNVISTTGNISRDYVYFNGRRIAFYSATSGNQHYYWSDHLGSARTMSNSDGSTIEWEGDYYPFGNKSVLNNNVDNYFLFTGYEFDYELGDNYADNREQLPVLGKFLSADPVLGDPANPQSLNRYSYVLNNPMNSIDPLGLCGETWNPATNTENWDDTGCVSSDYYWLMFFANSFFDPPQPVSTGGNDGTANNDPKPQPQPQPQKPANQPSQCTTTILNAVNSQFGTSLTPGDVQGNPFSNGGATNLNIFATGLAPGQFNSIQPGRYPERPLTWLIGYGSTLHVTGRTFLDPTATFVNSNVGGDRSVLFTAHVDTSFAYNPIGALIHLVRDVLHIGGPRKPC